MCLACKVRFTSSLQPALGQERFLSATRIEQISRDQENKAYIFKSVRHWRLQNERDVLLRFQSQTSYIRPLLDQIEDPPALILAFMEDELLRASNAKTLTRPEVKYTARGVLEVLDILHKDGLVHTGKQRP